MSQLFQIYEDDLSDLERMLPRLTDVLSMTPNLTPEIRVKLRRCQTIISNVRWGYGPPSHVERLPADDGENVS